MGLKLSNFLCVTAAGKEADYTAIQATTRVGSGLGPF